MSLIATEIKELRQMLKQLDAGEITTNVARTKLQVYKESHKRSKLYLDMFIACGQRGSVKELDKIISKEDVLQIE